MSFDCESIRLVIMDLDGTLTQHKSKLDTRCREVLERLSERYRLLMVCAGGCERVYRQMEGFPVDILGFYGMQWSSVGENGLVIIKDRTVSIDRCYVLQRIEELRKELSFTEYYGEPVEFHDSGIITFPILGTEAPLNEKLIYDSDKSKRRAVYNRVCELFRDFTVFIGGSSSFDIAPPPYRKLFAVEEYMREKGFHRGEIVYLGDDYGMGGNDEDVYLSGIPFITIDDYKDFPAIVEDMLL